MLYEKEKKEEEAELDTRWSTQPHLYPELSVTGASRKSEQQLGHDGEEYRRG